MGCDGGSVLSRRSGTAPYLGSSLDESVGQKSQATSAYCVYVIYRRRTVSCMSSASVRANSDSPLEPGLKRSTVKSSSRNLAFDKTLKNWSLISCLCDARTVTYIGPRIRISARGFLWSYSIAVLREGEAGIPVVQILRKHGISQATRVSWCRPWETIPTTYR